MISQKPRRLPFSTKRNTGLSDWWEINSPTRLQKKMKAIRDRIIKHGSIGKSCPCDYCKSVPGYEMHELINKNRVPSGEDREKTEEPELVSILCHACHQRSHNPFSRKALFLRNIETYGRDRVWNVFQRVPEIYRSSISFPDEI